MPRFKFCPPADRRPSPATLVGLTPAGVQDGLGDATIITATYEITPPFGDWTVAADGVYTVQLLGSAITDLAGNTAQQGTVGAFVNLAQTAVDAANGNFSAQVIVPSELSGNQPAIVYVDYTNTGTVPYAAPMVVLSATQNSQAGAFLSLDPSLAGIVLQLQCRAVRLQRSGGVPGQRGECRHSSARRK